MEQANFVYKKTESGEMINTKTLQHELEHEGQLNRIDDTSGETNPCKELKVNNIENRTIVSTDGTVVNFKQHAKLHTIW